MKIEVGDHVIYQRRLVQKEEKDIPTIELTLIKVIEVIGDDGEYFKDKDNEVYDHFRVSNIYREGDKMRYDRFDGLKCSQEDFEKLKKGV